MSNNSKNRGILWLIMGISIILFSIGILVFTATNSRCQIGPAMCSAKNWSAYVGFFLGAIAILQFLLIFLKKNQSKIITSIYNNRYGLLTFGIFIIISSIILATIGFTNESLNPSGAAMTPGAAMVISAIPVAIAGVLITCFGIYCSNKAKNHLE